MIYKIVGFFLALAGVAMFVTMRGADLAYHSNAWEISESPLAGRVHLKIRMSTANDRTSKSMDVPVADLKGLTPTQLDASRSPAHFEIARDAGVFHCEGTIGYGRGSGSYTFTGSPDFSREMQTLGFGSVTEEQALHMALHDIGLAFARELRGDGIVATADDLIRLRIHGVSSEFLRDAKDAGYKLSAEDAVQLRIHGVSGDYLRGLKSSGYSLSPDDIVQLRIHGVRPELLNGLRSAGYVTMSAEDLVQLQIHGITASYVQDLKDAGYGPLRIGELTKLRIHGVTADYIRSLRAGGFGDLSIDQIIDLRIHGVSGRRQRAII
jgi:hypothetical protein